jgi:hypothetical protein
MHGGHLHDPALVLSNVVIVGGKIRGSWRRTLGPNGVRVQVHALDRFEPVEMAALEEAGRRFGRYLERPAELQVRI